MLIEIFALGLTIVFIFTFFYVNNYYENSKKISAAKHYAEQRLSREFIELAQLIRGLRNSNNTNLASLEIAMDRQDALVEKYQQLVDEQVQAKGKGLGINIRSHNHF